MKTTEVPGLRNRFARGVRLPLHLRLVGAIKRAISWDVPLEKPKLCKTEGHKFDLRNWKGHRNHCEECGAWITNHETVRPIVDYRCR